MNKPTLMPYTHHAIMCCGKSCGENLPLLNYLKERIIEEGLIAGDENAVRVNRAGCLGVCMSGPIMVVYPSGTWYYHLDEDAIDQIIEEHFKGGKPVESLSFYHSRQG